MHPYFILHAVLLRSLARNGRKSGGSSTSRCEPTSRRMTVVCRRTVGACPPSSPLPPPRNLRATSLRSRSLCLSTADHYWTTTVIPVTKRYR